jgi:hypothetical protein
MSIIRSAVGSIQRGFLIDVSNGRFRVNLAARSTDENVFTAIDQWA